jgi:hypothetical protein
MYTYKRKRERWNKNGGGLAATRDQICVLMCYHRAKQRTIVCTLLRSILSLFLFFHTQIIIVLQQQSNDKRLKIKFLTAAIVLKLDDFPSI